MAVRIRMKRMGRKHRPFFRICATDVRSARDGRVLEELGHYDPGVRDTDARAILKGERIAYWLSVGAQPSDKVRVLIKKYGQNGTHLDQQKEALEKLKAPKVYVPMAAQRPEKKGAKPDEAQETPDAPEAAAEEATAEG